MTDSIPSPSLKPGFRITAAVAASRPDADLAGFVHRFATVAGVRIHYVDNGHSAGGDTSDTALPEGTGGDAVKTRAETSAADPRLVAVLLAGFPESGYAWRKVMPLLARGYRVIVPDLPGQGDSDRPQAGYDTESLANAVHGLLRQLGIRRYFLAGHDIGAWVAYPYALMFGDEVRRLALLDAGIPGITLPDALPTAPDRAWRTWHFAFHAIADLPEVLIAGREREYLDWFLRRKTANPQSFTEADIDEYLRAFKQDGGLRAGLAYYREAALSAAQNRRLSGNGGLAMPVLALSADQGSIIDMAAPLRAFADNVQGVVVPHCGHFLPEEQPEAVARELEGFFSAG
ncbi:alpha/beta fold hydrolase [Sodalis sp. C49]|uniref:alpha/beta fold hydrolase n=1 Tax=Sodalis sp. C49 TaxID=3228929 RepID=UPI003965BD73